MRGATAAVFLDSLIIAYQTGVESGVWAMALFVGGMIGAILTGRWLGLLISRWMIRKWGPRS